MPQILDRPVLAAADGRAILAAANTPSDRAAVALALGAGLRPGEIDALTVDDYRPGEAWLRTGTVRHPRRIHVAATVARLLDACLVDLLEDDEGPLLPEASTRRVVDVVGNCARAAGVVAGAHDLRRAAMARVLDAGLPASHMQLYFGLSYTLGSKDLAGVPEGYGTRVSEVLDASLT